MAPPRHIAPSSTAPVSIAPVGTDPVQQAALKPPEPQQPAVAATDVIFVNGQAFNGRGYQVCGVANQRGRLCGRIGQCPFHAKKNGTAKRPRPLGSMNGDVPANATGMTDSVPDGRAPVAVRNALHPSVRQMDIPPQKSRFKRSWTTDEHRRFLQAMRRHGKGKWKEIAVDVKTRNANQCQSHAQKYFLRQAKSDAERKKKSIHDVTEEDVSNELAPAAVWPPSNPLHALAQRASQASPVPIPSTSAASPIVSTPAHIRPPSSGVPLAPRLPVDPHGVPSMAVDAASVGKAPGLPASSALPTSLGLPLPGDAENLASWGASLSTSTAPPASAPMPSAPASSNGGNATVPVVFPMTSLGLPYASMVPSFINQSLGNSGSPAVVAPPPPQKLRVTVHINGKLKGGMALMLPKTIEEFFEQAQAKLQFDGMFSRVFTRSGGEITLLDEMCQDDMLWLSTGEDFLTPR